ncbi:MAG TPA: PKD domain-containing protein, partial [bacterium]|nr:PKD domain-containing protein [bacterium]
TGNAILNDLVTQVPVTNYRTYQFFVVDVALPAIPPEALFLYCTEGNLSVGVEERYDGSWSRMSNYPLVAWEWDFSYDETEGFNVEDTGRMVWHAFNEPGIYRVALRVRDEAGLEDLAYTDTVVGGLPTWQNPQRLTDNIFFETFGGPTEPANAIDVSADGVINLVYSYVSQDFTFFTEVAWIQLYPCDPIWSPPQVIWQSPPGTSAPLDVSLAVTEGDYSIIHVATASDTNSYLYLRYEDFQWNPPVAITDPTTEGTWVNGELARNDEGQVGFVGEIIPPQPDAMNGDGIPALPAQLYFHQRSGGGFGAATQIGTADVVTELTGRGSYTSISPSLAFSGAAGGGFMAVWETLTTPYDGQTTVPADAPTNLKWNHRTGATWDGEAGLPAPFNRVDAPVLALAPNGSVWLAASAGDAGNVYVNKYLPAGWTFWAPHLIEPDSTGAMVDLTIDADGRGALVIAQETGNNDLQARVFDEDEMPDTAAGHNPLVNVESRISQRRWWPQIQGQNSGRFAAVWMTEKYAAFPDGGELDWNMFQ